MLGKTLSSYLMTTLEDLKDWSKIVWQKNVLQSPSAWWWRPSRSDVLVSSPELTWSIIQEDFSTFIHHESLKSYVMWWKEQLKLYKFKCSLNNTTISKTASLGLLKLPPYKHVLHNMYLNCVHIFSCNILNQFTMYETSKDEQSS